MDQNTVLAIAIVLPLGVVLLALCGYMYDRLQKDIPREDKENTIFSAYAKLIKVFYLSPVVFLKRSIQKRDMKGIIISVLFFSILIFAIIWGNFLV